MSPGDKNAPDAASGQSTPNATDAKTPVKEEDTIPILSLTTVSKKGLKPIPVTGSLMIPMEDCIGSEATTAEPLDIVKNAALQPKPIWHVYVSLRNDNLPKATVVKGKVCQRYVCINALFTFDETDTTTTDNKLKVRPSDVGEWLLPIKIDDNGKIDYTKGKLLAYVKVKIECQTDTPAQEPAKKDSSSQT